MRGLCASRAEVLVGVAIAEASIGLLEVDAEGSTIEEKEGVIDSVG
jgi:hypothetical protein